MLSEIKVKRVLTMRPTLIPVWVLIFCSVFSSCRFDSKGHDMGKTSFLKMDEERLKSSIENVLNEIPDTLHENIVWLKQMYAQHQFAGFWVAPDKIQKCDTLIRFLKKADEHGLSVSFFISDSLRHEVRLVKTQRMSYYELAKTDIQLTFSYLNYSTSVIHGVIQPGKELPNYHFYRENADSVFTSRLLYHQQSNLFDFLSAMQLKDAEYLALMAERKRLSNYLKDSFPAIPYLSGQKALKKGDTHPCIPFIVQRLKITGELPPEFPDTLSTMSISLLNAIDKFRKKVGLKPGDDVGNHTIRNLNMTPNEWLEKVNINLERNRWISGFRNRRKYISVNVADMTLKAYRADTLRLSSKVCVGKMPDNKTPFLQSKITEIILNPVWSVPSSIIVKEISQTVQKDTAYFRRNKMKVFHKGRVIDPKRVDWTKVSKTNQPFRVIQEAGDINSLGKIKFNFANPFGVYLHDTNAKRAFLRQNRAVSHGCVRVEKPLELTFFCLPESDPENRIEDKERDLKFDKIRHAIQLYPQTDIGKELLAKDSLRLKTNKLGVAGSISLLIDYRTCFRATNNHIVYAQDVYGADSIIQRVLSKKLQPIKLFD